MNVQEISLKCLKRALLAIKLAVFPIDGGLSVQWVLELCLHNVFDVVLLLFFYDIVRQGGYLSRVQKSHFVLLATNTNIVDRRQYGDMVNLF